MTNDFQIHYNDSATPEQIESIQKVLTRIGFEPIVLDYENKLSKATLEWGISNSDCAALKSWLNKTANIVLAAVPYLPRKVAINNNYWNRAFTELLRATNQAAWGNWTLNPAIQPGAVGILNPDTGSFTPVTSIPDVEKYVRKLTASEGFVLESSSVRQTETEVEFKGGYVDPSSGTTVTTGLEVAWTFSHEGSLVSNATLTGLSVVDNFGKLMQDKFDWFLDVARSHSHSKDGGILQGFGMITQVQTSRGGG